MALVNVGVQLAQSGKKVLLVDFDLEAPGLRSFELEHPEEDSAGIVDYISDYLEQGEAPDVLDHVYQSNQFPNGGGLWIMPVGRQDAGYSQRLNSINWQTLYAEKDGYLLFEDMKRQWEKSLNVDYVLIDSRTGHSDVEGICTRQLPNAVCLVFLPNEQNLQGLKRIVSNIRAENQRSHQRNIVLHFVVSNVPDLDDEQRILDNRLRSFRRELGFSRLASEIHHYNSLSLLSEEVFSIKRPNSRLTKEYKRLTTAIARENLRDRDAVLELLRNRGLFVEGEEIVFSSMQVVEKLPDILANFVDDGEIAYRVALVYEDFGENSEALSLLKDPAVERTYPTSAMYAARARLNNLLGNAEDSVRDLTAMLRAGDAAPDALVTAISLIERLAPNLFEELPTSRALLSLPIADRFLVASRLEGGEQQLRAKLRILLPLADHSEDRKVATSAKDEVALTAIALGEFAVAVQVLEDLETPNYMQIQTAFNLAMARWGKEGAVNVELLQRVIDLDKPEGGYAEVSANYMQCLALTHALLGNLENLRFFAGEARKKISRKVGREFSAWMYARVDTRTFVEHVNKIEAIPHNRSVLPDFIQRHRTPLLAT